MTNVVGGGTLVHISHASQEGRQNDSAPVMQGSQNESRCPNGVLAVQQDNLGWIVSVTDCSNWLV